MLATGTDARASCQKTETCKEQGWLAVADADEKLQLAAETLLATEPFGSSKFTVQLA